MTCRPLVTIKAFLSGLLNKLKGWTGSLKLRTPFCTFGSSLKPKWANLCFQVSVCFELRKYVWTSIQQSNSGGVTNSALRTGASAHPHCCVSYRWPAALNWPWRTGRQGEVFYVPLALISHSGQLIIYDKLEPSEVSNVMATAKIWNDNDTDGFLQWKHTWNLSFYKGMFLGKMKR